MVGGACPPQGVKPPFFKCKLFLWAGLPPPPNICLYPHCNLNFLEITLPAYSSIVVHKNINKSNISFLFS